MFIKIIEICQCLHRDGNKLTNRANDVVVDLGCPELIGKRTDGEQIYCGQSSTGTVVNLVSRQIGKTYEEGEIIANVLVGCSEVRCKWHSGFIPQSSL